MLRTLESIREKFKVPKAVTIYKETSINAKPIRTVVPKLPEFSILDVTIVIPTLNEEKNIEDVLQELKSLGYENILVIDGRSKDETANIAARNGAKVVLQNGKGKGNAIRQVFGNGYLDADVVVMMDADGSMDPKEISDLIEAIRSGADIVKGSRFLKAGYSYDMNSLRRIGNRLMVTVTNLLCSANYTDLCYGFAAFNRRAIEKMRPVLKSQNFEIEAEIFLKALDLGLVVEEVRSVEYEGRNGESNLNSFQDGYKILKLIVGEFVNSALKRQQ